MRLDIDVPNPLNKTAKVFLDGVEQTECLIADEEEGYIKRFKRDKSGRPFVEVDDLATEVIHGKVEIKVV